MQCLSSGATQAVNRFAEPIRVRGSQTTGAVNAATRSERVGWTFDNFLDEQYKQLL